MAVSLRKIRKLREEALSVGEWLGEKNEVNLTGVAGKRLVGHILYLTRELEDLLILERLKEGGTK